MDLAKSESPDASSAADQVDLSRFHAAGEPQDGDEKPRRRVALRSRRAEKTEKAQKAHNAQAAEQPQGLEKTEKTEAARKAGRRGQGRLSRSLVRLVVVLAIAALAAVLLRVFVVEPFYIPSESMEPTLHGCTGCNDDRILVDKVSYRFHDIHVNDIVVFDRPEGDYAAEKVLIKRVVATGGETVSLRGGHVYVNGLRKSESYINKACGPNPSRPLTGTSSWTVPENDVFVMGDNRCDSHDSRAFGPIADSTVLGRAFVIIWPLGRIHFF